MPIPARRLVLANWGRRFLAWFIDVLFVGLIIGYMGFTELELAILPPFLQFALPFVSPITSISLFAYWTILEWHFGRSIGKLMVGTAVIGEDGKPITLLGSAIQSFGKVLIPFIDCPLAWTVKSLKDRRQRLFNGLSRTVVIKLPIEEGAGIVEFVKER